MIDDWQRSLLSAASQISMEFFSSRRHCFVHLSPDGSGFVRASGGPDFSMGRVMNYRSRSVPTWQIGNSTLHSRLLAALAAEGFPFSGEEIYSLVPDEKPPYLVLRHTNGARGGVSMSSRFLDAHRSLRPFTSELDQLCEDAQRSPATGNIPNPELSDWRGVTQDIPSPEPFEDE